jgi:Xaa-Pro dipeptidase
MNSAAPPKRPGEVAAIQHAAELVAAGHGAVRDALMEGVTELDLWAAASTAMERVAGGPVDAGVDLLLGERTALVDGSPGRGAAVPGDPVLFDLAPRRDGYYADSCATFVLETPSRALRQRHAAVRRALDHGIDAARPGVRARDVDRAVRVTLADAGLECPHHIGHGVGTAPQEPPWLVPEDETVLEEGMVLAIEPGAYTDGFGVRLEHLVLIEVNGARVLTTHSLDLT